MKGKILLVVGVGIGYVLGARAGRESYDRIAAAADKFWSSPRVQKRVNSAEDFVKDKAPDVADFLADGAKKVVRQVSGSKSAETRTSGKSATKSTRSTTPTK
ncbi:YtxH domain-containing protein [Salinibacterium sp.]|uniref:YtxH domain-containing protein n=1 Tax=Salinibacterium sp. TaxID=1915057 RepID=UPI00286CC8F2|nr:YtxH domain-containing protein [Salinibacterium sp.]